MVGFEVRQVSQENKIGLLRYFLLRSQEGNMQMYMAMRMARLMLEKRDLGLANFSGCALIKTTKPM
jgi:hypothetical protein